MEVDCTLLSDNRRSLFEGGVSVLAEIGFENHETYPANVHQYISMNDNRLHGTSKQKWRNSGLDFSDDVESCLTLLKYFDEDTIKHIKYWFDRNLLELKESGVPDLIASAGSKKSHLLKGWLRSYNDLLGGDTEIEGKRHIDNLNDDFSGPCREMK